MKKPHVARRADALAFLKRANRATDPQRRQIALNFAAFLERAGRLAEARGLHKSGYQKADAAAIQWMQDEAERAEETRLYTLAERYVDTHPKFPGASREAKVKRLVRRVQQWTKIG